MEIIKSSVSLFSVIMLGIVLMSYIIYKFKDQTRVKPYDRLLEEKNVAAEKQREETLMNQKRVYEENLYRQEQLMIEQQRQQQLKMNIEMRSKNNVINQDAYRREALAEKRFRVLNSPVIPAPAYAAPNIYELYSQNEKEQMHKLKLAAN